LRVSARHRRSRPRRGASRPAGVATRWPSTPRSRCRRCRAVTDLAPTRRAGHVDDAVRAQEVRHTPRR
jgi:hypothetical protein